MFSEHVRALLDAKISVLNSVKIHSQGSRDPNAHITVGYYGPAGYIETKHVYPPRRRR